MINQVIQKTIAKSRKDIADRANRLLKQGQDSLPEAIAKASSKETLATVGLGGTAATMIAYKNGDDTTKEAISNMAMIGAGLAVSGAGLVPAQRALNKVFKTKTGAMSRKVVAEAPIEVPGFYSGGVGGQIGALAKTVPGTLGRIKDRFLHLNKGAGVELTGLGTQAQESITKANAYRDVATEAQHKFLSKIENPGEMTKKQYAKWKQKQISASNKIKEVADYRHAERVAHYDIEKDYVNMIKFGQDVPPALKRYMKPFMNPVSRTELNKSLGGGHRVNHMLKPWKGSLKSRDTVYMLNKNVNPDSVTWDMMKDPVYHNLMVTTQNKHGLNVTLDQIMDYAKKEGLNVKKRYNGNLLINYSPRAKTNYLKGGTNAMLEFHWDTKHKRAIPTWVNSDVFDLIGTDKLVKGKNVIIFTKPHTAKLESLDFRTQNIRKTGTGEFKGDKLPDIEIKKRDFFTDKRFGNVTPQGVLNVGQRDIMNNINLQAKNATDNYSMRMDPRIKEKLTRRAVAGLTLGLPVGLGIYGAFGDD